MANNLLLIPSFNDLKKKSSGGGGFSDGGVLCMRKTLGAQAYVEIGPPPGVAWGGFNAQGDADNARSVAGVNFDTVSNVLVDEYFVAADGTQTHVGATPLAPKPGVGCVAAVSDYFSQGNILAFPNKLRYRLSQFQQDPLPTARVLLRVDVVEFDLPKDQED